MAESSDTSGISHQATKTHQQIIAVRNRAADKKSELDLVLERMHMVLQVLGLLAAVEDKSLEVLVGHGSSLRVLIGSQPL